MKKGKKVDTEMKKFEEGNTAFSILYRWSFWTVTSGILMLKCLLIPSYHSTDFEVHRNWMAITANLPIEQWYYDETSKWTLDYPPFFAYFECIWSLVANQLIPSSLRLQKEPIFSLELLYFHRFTVILTDMIYIFGSAFCANCLARFSRPLSHLSAEALGITLVANIPLILVDNIHFQYNSFLTSFLLFSIGFASKKNYLLAALFFSILLNFKHIYLYYAPAYIVFYLAEYFCVKNTVEFLSRILKLGLTVILPFGLSFGVFAYRSGVMAIWQIISRLFPFQRGLTHAYWAPNLWACYNFVDFSCYNVLKFLGKLPIESKPPAYTSGLVQEYFHSILPNIPAVVTLLLTLLLLTPMVTFLFNEISPLNRIAVLLTHSAFAFFLAGYHVHEKAIIMILIPYTVLAFSDHKYIRSLMNLYVAANISLFPLFFTFFENCIKVTLAVFSYFFMSTILGLIENSKQNRSFLSAAYHLALIAVQSYSLLIHPVSVVT
ncbi:unnamed protein product [Enterobius vermicularis]|uniref:Alpha-1,3-glucosyltransferase n=1 Tax=Enterobius vermicularis TaxID=51028 RepID=A0A0N4V6C2_ENTVE|nr:unnamed protein product [Enterobius vermicularis]